MQNLEYAQRAAASLVFAARNWAADSQIETIQNLKFKI